MSKYSTFIEHPDGGTCNLEGMTADCYGCICYGGGLISECRERVDRMKEKICLNLMIPREWLFNECASTNDSRLCKLIRGFHSDKPVKINKGHYLYKGYAVYSIGYYEPEHCICWEAVDINGCAIAHGKSFAECKLFVDDYIDRKHEQAKENK